jgi:Tol biopolymer transport system component
MAERSYERLSRVLTHEVGDKIPLVLYSSHTDFQQTNITASLIGEGTGGLTEFAQRRVLIPFTGSYAELEHVLTHELIHAFQVDILFGDRDGLLSSALAFNPPLWFMEGMAEYLSLGSVDNHTRMWLRDGALQGYLIPIEELSYVGDIRVYRFGQAIWAYIAEKYGDEKIGQILHKASATRNLPKTFESVIGVTLEKLSEDWTEQMRRTYLPAIADHQKPSQFARVLTNHEKDLSNLNLAPAVSPDGDRVVYISDRSLYNDIYLASAIDGKALGRLVKGERAGNVESLRFLSTSLSWSPDGRRIAFPAKVGGEDALYIFDVKHKKVLSALRFGLDGLLSPAWSPDGLRLVFVGLKGGRSDLYIANSDGGGLRALTDDLYSARDPQFSSDGRRIAFATDMGPGTDFEALTFGPWRLAILDIESGRITVPANQAGKCLNPFWSPDDSEIAYISDRDGISNLYVLNTLTGESRRVTDILTGITGITDSSPALSVSRDGRRAIFAAFSGGGWDLFALKDPFALPALERIPAPEEEPVASSAADSMASEARPSLEAGFVQTAAVIPAALFASVLETGDGELPVPHSTEPKRTAVMAMAAPPDTALDQAAFAAATLPDPEGFSIRRYKLRVTADYVSAYGFFQSNVGLAGQTVVSFSDVLGNHSFLIGAAVYGSLADSDLLFQYMNLENRIHYGVALYQFRNDFYLFTAADNDQFLSQIYRGAEVSFSRPFSLFSRIEFGLEGVSVSERVFQQSFVTGDQETVDKRGTLYFARPLLAWVHDNALYGYTGPISGGRQRISAEHAFGDAEFSTVVADLREYLNIRQRHLFALRVIGAGSVGNDPQRFRLGGPFTLRGLDYGEIYGPKVALMNAEFRFPFIDDLALGWPLPLRFRGIRGVFFFDAGAAWDDNESFRAFDNRKSGGFRLEDVVASYGFGTRVNLGFFVLRYDLAQRTDLARNVGDARHHIAIGADF